jgi:4-hydroxy-tetrahydrodipicolinate synthase
MRTPFTGAGTALITPFTRNGEVDLAAVRRLGRRQIDAGIHFISPCSTTGENPTLTMAERFKIVEILVEEAAGRVPVLAGAGGYDTKEVVRIAREMERIGANGLLSVTPYYNKPTQEGLYQHYRTACASSRLSKRRPLSGVFCAWPTPASTFPLRSGSPTRHGRATTP